MEPNSDKKQSQENIEKPFFVRPYEEVENGFYDDRGFYTTPNGSFWDEELTYFNHYGFDQYGGSYDKYGIYHPGEGYDEKMGMYNNQKEFLNISNISNDDNNINNQFNSNLIEQELKDENIIKKFEQPVEESEEDDDEDNDDNTFNFDELKEVYDDIIKNEIFSKNNSQNKIIEQNETITKEKINNLKYLEVNVSEECDDSVVAYDENGQKIDENLSPLKSKDFNFKVDVDNGKILNWSDKKIFIKVYMKAKDTGLYKYYDKENKEIYKECGHVPYFLGINSPAYDDDINFDTDVNGFILKWNERNIKDKIIKYLQNIELNDNEIE